jgi:putative transposase
MPVFRDDEDCRVFLRMLAAASKKHDLEHLGYSLMLNHEHLVSIPMHKWSLSHAMRDTLGPYASYFNGKYGFSGRLWQGRFYSVPLDESHFWAALRYVERNPVRAGIVLKAEDYQWSSAAGHCGLKLDPMLSNLPPGAASIRDWSDWLHVEETRSDLLEIRKTIRRGRPTGPESFLKELERITGRSLILKVTGRPRKRQ